MGLLLDGSTLEEEEGVVEGEVFEEVAREVSDSKSAVFFWASKTGICLLIFAKSLLRAFSAFWCADKCAFVTAMERSPSWKYTDMPPLLPSVLPAPVATAADVMMEHDEASALCTNAIKWVA